MQIGFATPADSFSPLIIGGEAFSSGPRPTDVKMPITTDQLALMIVVIMAVQGLWLSFFTYRMWKQAQKHAAGRGSEAVRSNAEANTLVEDLFLLHRRGVLIRHYTRRLRRMVDSDILGGMLTVIQEFVKDSFHAEPGHLNEIRFGEVRIQIAAGHSMILALVVRGEQPADLVPRLQEMIGQLEVLRPDPVAEWERTQQLPAAAERLLEAFVADPLAFSTGTKRGSVLTSPIQ